MEFTGDWDKAKWNAFVRRIQKNLSASKIDLILKGIAWAGVRKVVQDQPWKDKKGGDKSGIGKGWKVKQESGEWMIYNSNKIALFIEEGTGMFGPKHRMIRPKNKNKKFLYIPLRPGAATWVKGMVYGKDFTLARKVKGIQPRHYLKTITEDVFKIMVDDFSKHLAAAGA